MSYQPFITNSLKIAAVIANKYFGKVKGTTKAGDNNQVLTKADLEVGKFLVNEITKHYPTNNIIDEEMGIIDKKSDYTWIVDPIDGTSNFAVGVPLYGIMIGLLKHNMPIAGGVILPFFSQLYIAEKEKGAYCNDKQIYVTHEQNLLKTLVVYQIDGNQENPELTKEEARFIGDLVLVIRNFRTSGSSALDAAMVARGGYGAYLNKESKIWDNVALQVIIEEAGGIYTDFLGKPINYADPLRKAGNNFTVCASSPVLHKQLQKIIHKE